MAEATVSAFDLHGKVALVTGGCGGLGSSICAALAEAGADVIVADITLAGVDQITARVEAMGRRSLAVEVDVTQSDSVQGLVDAVCAEFGRIDILVNSHGVTRRMPSAEFTEQDWDHVIEVNLKGVFLTCQRVGRVMLAQRRGSIINFSSIGGLVGLPHSIAYCASKGGVILLTRSLGVEWAPLGVRVNAIAPSPFDTPMVRGAMKAEPEYRQRVVDKVPIGRVAAPEEIVGAVLFLASEAASMVTGSVLPVDGGYTAL